MASQPDHPYAFAFSPNSDKDWTDIEHTSEDGRTNTSNIKTEPLEDSPSVSVEDWMDTDVHFRAFTLLQTPVPDETFPTDAIHPQTEMEETSLWPGYPGPDQQTQATQPVDHDPGFQMNWPSERPANSSSTYEEQDHSDQLQQNRHNVNDSVWQVEYGGLGQQGPTFSQHYTTSTAIQFTGTMPTTSYASDHRQQEHNSELYDLPNRRTTNVLDELRIPIPFEGQQRYPQADAMAADVDAIMQEYNESATSRIGAPNDNTSNPFDADVSTSAASEDGEEIYWGQKSDVTVVPDGVLFHSCSNAPRIVPTSSGGDVLGRRPEMAQQPHQTSIAVRRTFALDAQPQEPSDSSRYSNHPTSTLSFQDASSETTSFINSTTSYILSCTHCSEKFTGRYCKGNLSRHVRSKHGATVRKFNCVGCSKSFARADAKLKHTRKLHPELVTIPVQKRPNMKTKKRSREQHPQNHGLILDRQNTLDHDLRGIQASAEFQHANGTRI